MNLRQIYVYLYIQRQYYSRPIGASLLNHHVELPGHLGDVLTERIAWVEDMFLEPSFKATRNNTNISVTCEK